MSDSGQNPDQNAEAREIGSEGGDPWVPHDLAFRILTMEYLDSVLAALPEAPSWTIKGALVEPAATSKVGGAAFSQPLCTAIQVGIVKLLHGWGVKPSVVVGHSSGEIGAAFAAGLLTEAQAIVIAFYRGYAVDKITSHGCMMAVGMDAEGAENIIEKLSLKDQRILARPSVPRASSLERALQKPQLL